MRSEWRGVRRESLPASLDTGLRRYDADSGVVGVVVFVLVSGMLGGVGWDSDAVFEHQVGELVAVDEADVLGCRWRWSWRSFGLCR